MTIDRPPDNDDLSYAAPATRQAYDKLPPQNIEAEQAVLGSLLIDREAIAKVATFLRAEDFYRQAHGAIFEAILELFDRHEPADLVTLCDELSRRGKLDEVGGAAYLTSLIATVPTAVHVEHYGHIVERCAIMRRLIHTSGEIARIGYESPEDVDTALDRAEQLLFQVSQRRLSQNFIPLNVALRDYFDQLDTLHQQKGQILGVPTGFADLDALLGGLHKSDLIIVAGRPSVGKTGFATCVAQHAAVEHRLPVAIFSLEMSVEQLVQRLLCSEARVDSQRLRTGYIDDEEWQRITQAFGTLSEAAVFIDDTPNISTLELRTKARRLKAEQDVSLIIIDYLQLMQGRGLENRVQEVSEISRSLKGLARELAVPVVALSQLSRAVESRTDHRPILSDLRESGCLAGDTLIIRADTGELVPIQELVGQSNVPVHSLDEHWRLVVKPIVRVFSSGHKPIFELQTATGRKIKASANHPFRTLEGWTRLDQLRSGDKIVISRALSTEGLVQLAESDVYWDEVRTILPLDTMEVFDATVADTHNFVANDFIVHNSLEQDADVVLFIHREELYNPQTEKRNIADIIVAKHRNGPTGVIPLRFFIAQTRFADLASKSFSDMA